MSILEPPPRDPYERALLHDYREDSPGSVLR